jgi:hypothetical protein
VGRAEGIARVKPKQTTGDALLDRGHFVLLPYSTAGWLF